MTDKKRALIVEDNLALARVTQFALESAGFETAAAHNGREALELTRDQRFDVIITDQQMPELTGIELCRELREMPDYQNCPIVLLTAKGLELQLHELRDELNIDAIFAKPFSPSAVVNEVNQLLAARV